MRIDAVTYFKNADKVLGGLAALEAELELTRCIEAIYGPLLIAAKARCAAFNRERAGRTAAYQALRKARPGAVKFLRDVRNHLSGPLGNRFSDVWCALGFNRSLRLPRTDAGRCQMLEKMRKYFTDHPEREGVADGYTAAQAELCCASFKGVVNGVDDCKYNARAAKDARKAALKALDKKLGALRRELETVLEPLDPRWLNFYDRIPGDSRRPKKVEDVTASVAGNILMAGWPDAPRADHYKVFKQVVGVDPEPVYVGTVKDSHAQFPVTPGTVVKLQVVPGNAMGDGPASDVLEVAA